MSRRVEYERLRTIEDVRRERLRVKMEIERTKHRLERDYDRINELFTVDFWRDLVMSKVSIVTSQFKSGWFSFVYNLLTGFLNRTSAKPRGCARNERYYDAEDEEELLIIREYEED